MLGEERAGRRLNRVFPDTSSARATRAQEILSRQEIPSTTRRAQAARTPTERAPGAVAEQGEPGDASPLPPNTGGVVRQWVSELAGAARPSGNGAGTVRVPSEAEIETLTAMFPDVGRDVVLGVLQRRYVIARVKPCAHCQT